MSKRALAYEGLVRKLLGIALVIYILWQLFGDGVDDTEIVFIIFGVFALYLWKIDSLLQEILNRMNERRK